jgi:hypothetical protein
MRFPRARLFALLATLVALLAAAAPARARYFCHMRERVVSGCCCPKAAAHTERVASSASAPDCCERIASANRAAVATTQDANASVPPPGMLAILPAYERVEPAREAAIRTAAQARAPPAVGPPAFISFCRLLI